MNWLTLWPDCNWTGSALGRALDTCPNQWLETVYMYKFATLLLLLLLKFESSSSLTAAQLCIKKLPAVSDLLITEAYLPSVRKLDCPASCEGVEGTAQSARLLERHPRESPELSRESNNKKVFLCCRLCVVLKYPCPLYWLHHIAVTLVKCLSGKN